MTKQESLEIKVYEFIMRQDGAFHLEELANDPAIVKIGKQTPFSDEELIETLEDSLLTFSADGLTFIPRHQYFKGARFLLSPTDEEIDEGILIPGHRFLPFTELVFQPWQCTLLSEEWGKLPRKVVAREIASLHIYFTLVGIEHMAELLCEDQVSNLETLEHEEILTSRARITVFDMDALFQAWHFKPGDAIICEVNDWSTGLYTISYLSAEQRREGMAASQQWTDALEQGFRRAFDTMGFEAEIDEQIAWAYFYAGESVLHTSPIHLGGFLDVSSKVYMINLGFETRLWYERDLTFSQFLKGSAPPGTSLRAAPDSFDSLLDALNTPCSEIEIEAFLRDEFFRHKGAVSPDSIDALTAAVVKRVFGDEARSFSSAQRAALEKHFKKVAKKVSKSYNYFQDQSAGKVRNGLLIILEDYHDWMNELKERFTLSQNSPAQRLAGLSQYMASFSTYLELLNDTGPEDVEAKELLELLPQINDVVESMKEGVEEQLLDSNISRFPARPQLRLVRPNDDVSKSIYVLRVTIQDIQPPIWRSVQVPGCFTLKDLHVLLQDVMEWNNTQQHCFQINDTYYGTGDFPVDCGAAHREDENTCTLDSLALAEQQRFLYIYDFVNEWVHLIQVNRILSPSRVTEADLYYPSCLGGRRAAPPEDCGGMAGYQSLLAAYNAPKQRRNLQLLRSTKSFDPEFFDIDCINDRLHDDE
ncbi:MAG: hypothetical protein LBS86_03850 [Treponema sp.]|nr:hypothetical protein [Treponema sp.]